MQRQMQLHEDRTDFDHRVATVAYTVSMCCRNKKVESKYLISLNYLKFLSELEKSQ